jgi:excisionase family DNA binding protein
MNAKVSNMSKILDVKVSKGPKGGPFVTTTEYAKRAGLTKTTVLRFIHQGKLPARTDLGKWARIPRAEYDKLPPLEPVAS